MYLYIYIYIVYRCLCDIFRCPRNISWKWFICRKNHSKRFWVLRECPVTQRYSHTLPTCPSWADFQLISGCSIGANPGKKYPCLDTKITVQKDMMTTSSALLVAYDRPWTTGTWPQHFACRNVAAKVSDNLVAKNWQTVENPLTAGVATVESFLVVPT